MHVQRLAALVLVPLLSAPWTAWAQDTAEMEPARAGATASEGEAPPPAAGYELQSLSGAYRIVLHDGLGGLAEVARWADPPDATAVTGTLRFPGETTAAIVRWEPPPGLPCALPAPRAGLERFNPATLAFERTAFPIAPPAPGEATATDLTAAPLRRVAAEVRAASSRDGSAPWARVATLEGREPGPPWRPGRAGDDASLQIRAPAGLFAHRVVLDLPESDDDVWVWVRTPAAGWTERIPAGRTSGVALPAPSPCVTLTFLARDGAAAPRVAAAWLDGDLVDRILLRAEPVTPDDLERWLRDAPHLATPDTRALLVALWEDAFDTFVEAWPSLPEVARGAALEALGVSTVAPARWTALPHEALSEWAERVADGREPAPRGPVPDAWVALLGSDVAPLRQLAWWSLLHADPPTTGAARGLLEAATQDRFGALAQRADAVPALRLALDDALGEQLDDPTRRGDALLLAAQLAPPLSAAWRPALLAALDDANGTTARVAAHLLARLDPSALDEQVPRALEQMARDDPHPELRIAAWEALRRLPAHVRSADDLRDDAIRALADAAPDVRWSAAAACRDTPLLPTHVLRERLGAETWPEIRAELLSCAAARREATLDEVMLGLLDALSPAERARLAQALATRAVDDPLRRAVDARESAAESAQPGPNAGAAESGEDTGGGPRLPR